MLPFEMEPPDVAVSSHNPRYDTGSHGVMLIVCLSNTDFRRDPRVTRPESSTEKKMHLNNGESLVQDYRRPVNRTNGSVGGTY